MGKLSLDWEFGPVALAEHANFDELLI